MLSFALVISGSKCSEPATPSVLRNIIASWEVTGYGLENIKSAPQRALISGIDPIPCHSHNDYWRKLPLFDALVAGCTSVEADVSPQDGNDDGSTSPLVGHTRASLTPERTLKSLYIDPIMALLEHQNRTDGNLTTHDQQQPPRGLFDNDSSASLILMLDFKTPDPALWSAVHSQLQPLRNRGWLTRWDASRAARVTRPVTVVLTGEASFASLLNATAPRDVFYDAPLARLEQETVDYDISNSHYASASTSKAIGFVGWSLTAPQQAILRRQIQAAANASLVSRYWGTPSWPNARRNAFWKDLMNLGVGVLSGDDADCMAGILSIRHA